MLGMDRDDQIDLPEYFSYQSCHGSSVEAAAKQESSKGRRVCAYLEASKP